jgi:hypothetical protein
VAPHTEEAVAFQTALLSIDVGEIVPYPPQVGGPRLTEQAKQLSIGLFCGVFQAALALLVRRDGSEEQISAHGGGNLTVLVKTDRLITAPNFAPIRAFQQRKLDFYDRAGKRCGTRSSERHNAEREGA